MLNAMIQPPPEAGHDTNAPGVYASGLQPLAAPAIWIRPPVGNAPCPMTNLRHAAFYRELVNNPAIRQARMGTGRSRGTRLLWLPDVFAEIHRRAEAQAVAAD